ncbi:MAG: hypothetical protein ACFFDN_42065 [Candidatus Hodarchaeota archaeon]
MSVIKKNELRFLGLRINKSIAVILFFFSFTGIIGYIPSLYYWSYLLDQLHSGYTFAELLERIHTLIQYWINFLIPLTLVIIYLYIVLNCISIRKSFRDREDFSAKWFGFRLTNTSLIVIFFLSLVNLAIDFYVISSSIGTLVQFQQYSIDPAEHIVVHYIITIITTSILVVINIYTIIICLKNRDRTR